MTSARRFRIDPGAGAAEAVAAAITAAATAPIAGAVSVGGSGGPSVGPQEIADTIGDVFSVTHDGITATYNSTARTLTLANTDKGSSAVTTHVAASNPHTQYALKAGDTFTGNVTLSGTGGIFAAINSPAGFQRSFVYQTGGVNRWSLATTSGAESGSNAGSDLILRRYSDAGSTIDTVLTINRASGLMTLTQGLTVGGTATLSGAASVGGALTVTGDASAAKVTATGNALRIQTSRTISTKDSTGNAGDLSWSNGYLYVCVGTNDWRRVALVDDLPVGLYKAIELLFAGTNGSTTFTDTGVNGNAVTRFGNAQISTAQAYSPATSSALFDNTGDYLRLAGSAIGDLSTKQWKCTIPVYMTAFDSVDFLLSTRSPSGTDYGINLFLSAGKPGIQVYNPSGTLVVNSTAASAISTSAWVLLEFGRDATNFYIKVGGSSVVTVSASGLTVGYQASNAVHIGKDPSVTTRDFGGHMGYVLFERQA